MIVVSGGDGWPMGPKRRREAMRREKDCHGFTCCLGLGIPRAAEELGNLRHVMAGNFTSSLGILSCAVWKFYVMR